MYRTGDVARLLADGTLEHLGRVDDQVKIRGHRVELGEIEACLASHGGVRAAVVSTFESGSGDVALVGYYIPAGVPGPSVVELREHLRGRLPAVMVPVSYVAMESFPVTPNNKVDRRRLPVPEVEAGESRRARSGLEARLVEIWAEVLGRHDIGIDDDFFDLGGHSLLAIRVFAAIERTTGSRLPLGALFRAPTIAGLAELMSVEIPAASTWTSLVAVQPAGSSPPFFYVSPFQITVLSFVHLARHLGSDQPFYVLQPQGMDRDEPVHQTVEDMAAHYIAEMGQVQPVGPYQLGGHCGGSVVAFEMARQLQAREQQVSVLVLVDSEPPNVEPDHINPLWYVISRFRHYWREGRLLDSLRWQLRLMHERHVTRRVGGAERQRLAVLRGAHAEAHRRYTGGTFTGDAVLIRSREWAGLPDKDWHLRWDELIQGELWVDTVPGTHSGLVETKTAAALAVKIRSAIDRSSHGILAVATALAPAIAGWS